MLEYTDICCLYIRAYIHIEKYVCVCVCVYERKGLHQFVSHTFSYHLNHGGTTEPCDDLKLYLLNRMAVLFSSCYSVQRERDSFGIGHFCTGCCHPHTRPPHTMDQLKRYLLYRNQASTHGSKSCDLCVRSLNRA